MNKTEKSLSPNNDNIPINTANKIQTKRKLLMVFSSWILAFLIACPVPHGIIFLPLFPLGFLSFLDKLQINQKTEESIMVSGWLTYLTLTMITLAMEQKKWFYIFWLILTILLVFNGAGCHLHLRKLPQIN